MSKLQCDWPCAHLCKLAGRSERLDRKKLKVSLQAGKPVAIRAELIHNDISVFEGI